MKLVNELDITEVYLALSKILVTVIVILNMLILKVFTIDDLALKLSVTIIHTALQVKNTISVSNCNRPLHHNKTIDGKLNRKYAHCITALPSKD